jgi:hypothetical protein
MYQVQCNGQNIGKPCATHAEARDVIKTEWRQRMRRGAGGISATTQWAIITVA